MGAYVRGFDGQPIEYSSISDVHVGKFQDVATGKVTGYWAEQEGEYQISEKTYDALESKGASVAEL